MFSIEKRPDANNVQTAVELKAAAALLVSPVEWNINIVLYEETRVC